MLKMIDYIAWWNYCVNDEFDYYEIAYRMEWEIFERDEEEEYGD